MSLSLRPVIEKWGESYSCCLARDEVVIRLQISRSTGTFGFDDSEKKEGGQVSAVFGLFLDLHRPDGAGIADYRLPSDALYCFVSTPEVRFFHLDPGNFMSWAQGHGYRVQLADKMLTLLRKHRNSASVLKATQPHAPAIPHPGFLAISRAVAVISSFWLFIWLYGLLLSGLFLHLFNGVVEVSPQLQVKVVRLDNARLADLSALSERIAATLKGKCDVGNRLVTFFCKKQYVDLLDARWRELSSAGEAEVHPWLSIEDLRRLGLLYRSSGWALVDRQSFIFPGRTSLGAGSSLSARIGTVLVFGLFGSYYAFLHLRGIKGLMSRSSGRRSKDEEYVGLVFQMAVFAVVVAFFVKPLLPSIIVTVLVVVVMVGAALAVFKLNPQVDE
jgi:hypothetical protein